MLPVGAAIFRRTAGSGERRARTLLLQSEIAGRADLPRSARSSADENKIWARRYARTEDAGCQPSWRTRLYVAELLASKLFLESGFFGDREGKIFNRLVAEIR
jgi:hypothetical protein